MKLIATLLKLDRTEKIKVEKRRRDETLIAFYTGKFLEHTDYTGCARRLGVSEEEVVELIDNRFRKNESKESVTYSLIGDAPELPSFRVRSEHQTGSTAGFYD